MEIKAEGKKWKDVYFEFQGFQEPFHNSNLCPIVSPVCDKLTIHSKSPPQNWTSRYCVGNIRPVEASILCFPVPVDDIWAKRSGDRVQRCQACDILPWAVERVTCHNENLSRRCFLPDPPVLYRQPNSQRQRKRESVAQPRTPMSHPSVATSALLGSPTTWRLSVWRNLATTFNALLITGKKVKIKIQHKQKIKSHAFLTREGCNIILELLEAA